MPAYFHPAISHLASIACDKTPAYTLHPTTSHISNKPLRDFVALLRSVAEVAVRGVERDGELQAVELVHDPALALLGAGALRGFARATGTPGNRGGFISHHAQDVLKI